VCRLVIIDDNPEDRILILRELSREFPNLEAEEIIDTEGLNQALNTGNFDLVITDYQLRWNDGVSVLQEFKSRYAHCPVIMFTDSGNQEIAVEAMKTGLDDYIIKSPKHYIRLSVAVRAALERAESKRKTERLEMRLETLLNRLNVGVFRSTLDGYLLEGNAAFLRLLAVSSLQEAQTLDLPELLWQADVELQGSVSEREVQLRRADGSSLWVLLNQTISTTEAEPVLEGLIEDISDAVAAATQRKRAEETLQRANEELESRVAERTQELRQANEQLLKEIREREQAQEVLRESEERYRQLVELSPDAIFIQCDEQFVFINSATVKLYRASNREELLGKSVLDVVHPDYQELVKEQLRELREGQPVELIEQKAVRFDGTIIDVEVAAAPFIYQEKPAAQVVVRDISDRKKAEAELRKALETERELSSLKSRIITTISHEYRTPLTTILSSAELLESYGDNLKQERKLIHLRRIQNSSKHLADLVSDVLFIGQAEADRLRFNPAPLNLEQFCQELVEEIRSASQNQRRVSASTEAPDNQASLERATPRELITFTSRGNCTNTCLDERLIRQSLTNLLSNAIKYSPQESTVRFDLECKESVAVLSIQDEGIGIPAEDLPKLFESFHRASNVGTIPGTGLGLAIVKKCLDLHGGQITVESVVGVGTTFIVTLPLNSFVSNPDAFGDVAHD
jgi:PAS domain S-box-containing protein